MFKKTKKATSSGVAGNTFAYVQGITGTTPTADSTTDVLSLTSDDGTLEIVGDASTDTLDFSVNVPGTNQKLAQRDSSGNLATVESMSVTSDNGLNRFNIIDVDNAGTGASLHTTSANFNPSVNSPNDTWLLEYRQAQIDTDSDGFSFGTGGNSVIIESNQILHQGTSDVGTVNFTQNTFTLGNGTDAIDVKGFGYYFGFGQVSANVNIDGPIQGYGFQPSIHASATIDVTDSYVQSFYDTADIDCASSWYTSFNSSPTIASIANNRNFQGVSVNPTIPVFTGNSNFTGIGVYGDLGTFGTGSFNGIQVNPNVDSVDYAVGLSVSMANVTATSKQAAYLDGDVQITGALSFGGALSIGKLNAFASQAIVNGGGIPSSVHGLISNPTIAANTTVALGDTIGVNTAMLLQMGDNSVVTSGLVGASALALPAVVTMGVGATIDQVAGASFAVQLDSTATGGTIANMDLCRSGGG